MHFIRFLFAGGIAALVNILSRFGLDFFFSYSASIVLAYLIGMVTAYLLMKRFVFENTGEWVHIQFGKFAIVNILSLFMIWSVSIAFSRIIFPSTGMNYRADDIAHVIGVFSTALTSYVLHKYFTFRSKD